MMKILSEATNGNKLYFIKVEVDDPVDFVKGIWSLFDTSVNNYYDDDHFTQELTHRGQQFRTRVNRNEVVVYTHSWKGGDDDKKPLPEKILEYLKSKTC